MSTHNRLDVISCIVEGPIQPSSRKRVVVDRPSDRSTKNSGGDAADGFGDISGEPVFFCHSIE